MTLLYGGGGGVSGTGGRLSGTGGNGNTIYVPGTGFVYANNIISSAATTTTSNMVNWGTTSGSGTSGTTFRTITLADCEDQAFSTKDYDGRVRVAPGVHLRLPDGAEIKVDLDGNYVVDDKDAKVVYKANRIREFNRYINASDALEEFLGYLGSMGVRKADVAQFDVMSFVSWLVIAASEADGLGRPKAEVLMIEDRIRSIRPASRPRCRLCGRFIPIHHEKAGLSFCDGSHADRYILRQTIVPRIARHANRPARLDTQVQAC